MWILRIRRPRAMNPSDQATRFQSEMHGGSMSQNSPSLFLKRMHQAALPIESDQLIGAGAVRME